MSRAGWAREAQLRAVVASPIVIGESARCSSGFGGELRASTGAVGHEAFADSQQAPRWADCPLPSWSERLYVSAPRPPLVTFVRERTKRLQPWIYTFPYPLETMCAAPRTGG